MAQALAPGEPLHMILFAALIIGFAFFYTALVFNSQETADNLKKSGALIPGIRPGKATADYIDGVLTRLTAAGALYLVLVCLLPEIMRTELGTSFYFGGTSLLIVVVVVMDFIAQIQAHLMSHQYESLLKKANLKGGSRRFCPRLIELHSAGSRAMCSPGRQEGRPVQRFRARVGLDCSARQSRRGAGQGGAQKGCTARSASPGPSPEHGHTPHAGFLALHGPGLPSNPRP